MNSATPAATASIEPAPIRVDKLEKGDVALEGCMVSPEKESRRSVWSLRILRDRIPLSGWSVFHRVYLRADGDQL